jgi:AAA domain, putative AbiEii toxin, Type IV TA system/AAA ATPase domain
MIIKSISIENYKSFSASGTITLGRGMTIVTGRNDSGKTAMLEGLSLRFGSNPHKSIDASPSALHPVDPNAKVRVRLEVAREELWAHFDRFRGGRLFIPLTSPSQPARTGAQESFIRLKEHPTVEATIERSSDGSLRIVESNLWLPDPSPVYVEVRVDAMGTMTPTEATAGINNESIELLLFRYLADSCLFVFSAQRYSIGKAAHGATRVLATDGVNLPTCLNDLSTRERRLYDKYLSYVRRVLPAVRDISVPPVVGQIQNVEIKVWYHDPAEGREDLAIPLSQCGTGVAQVLLMLYIVVESQFPRLIVIDEPNTFLHPGALRALVQIFREFPQHQYVLSTHSPELIGLAEPDALLIVSKQGLDSSLKPISQAERSEMEFLLRELGASLASVFGAERILWVEGAVEKACFPLLLRRLAKTEPPGLAIESIVNTGDFLSAKHQGLMVEVYRRLTAGTALVPPAVGFIFDRESRSDEEIDNLRAKLGENVAFLPLRMYENYLLHPESIADVLGDALAEVGVARPTHLEVSQWIEAQIGKDKYYVRATQRDRQRDVDAATLLKDLFSELSRGTLEYTKTKHSVSLTHRIMDRSPEQLRGLADFVSQVATRPC